MIVKSDNACAEALYKKIGYQKTIDDVRKLGLPNTVLDSEAQKTSAGDLATFLTKLQSGSIGLKDSSRERLLDAMKRNQYRQGIPSGASGAVANKVGFLNGLLHDAAIVNSSKGDYVLVIMTDGSSWANIADLTQKIESLR
jgi:beta-lactamase class A